MSDLRESGAIEQDTDVILFIYRDGSTTRTRRTRAWPKSSSASNNGPIGTVRLTFLSEHTRFENFATPGSY
jgi:replicative DNA helicase